VSAPFRRVLNEASDSSSSGLALYHLSDQNANA
jgi:hypothetical protein